MATCLSAWNAGTRGKQVSLEAKEGGEDCFLRDSGVEVCSLTEAQNLHVGHPPPPTQLGILRKS